MKAEEGPTLPAYEAQEGDNKKAGNPWSCSWGTNSMVLFEDLARADAGIEGTVVRVMRLGDSSTVFASTSLAPPPLPSSSRLGDGLRNDNRVGRLECVGVLDVGGSRLVGPVTPSGLCIRSSRFEHVWMAGVVQPGGAWNRDDAASSASTSGGGSGAVDSSTSG